MGRTLPGNDELAERFELLADLLELDGADAFRLAAYRRAAQRIRESVVSVADLALEGKAKRLAGIGGTIEKKIVELAETGDLEALRKLRARLPEGLVDVLRVPGLGPKTARRLWAELGVTGVDELRAAAEAGRVRALSGLGEKTEERILRALTAPVPGGAATGRVLLGSVLPFVERVVGELAAHPAAERVSEAGSVRRRVETVRDLDVIATAREGAELTAFLAGRPWVTEVLALGPTKAAAVTVDGLRLDLRVVSPACYGNLLQHFTGSKEHNVALREEAVRHGLSVSEYGIETVATGEVSTHETEEALYEALGYAWIPPELRENRGELEAARAGTLPLLVRREDVLGDLHTHTDWSDGRATLAELVASARARGHRYLAICDHAKRLGGEWLERQTEAIRELAASLDDIELLCGVEVDIRADGSLDLDDGLLADRDWVVASVHSGLRDPAPELTRRVLAAVESPHVDCIGHPTGRKLNRRAASDLDLEAVIARCAETGTFLEVNGQPDRLDLRDTHVRLAAEAGVGIVLSSDAHSAAALDYLGLAVGQARRGWLTAAQVVNARPWPEVKEMMKR